MEKSIVSLPDLDSGKAEALTLRLERDLCYECAQEVVAAVQYLIGRQPGEIIVELGRVDTVDSSGLRALLVCRDLCDDAGIAFRLDKLSDSVLRIIRLSGLAEAFGLAVIDPLPRDRKPGIRLGPLNWRTTEHVAASHPAVIATLREKVANAAEEVGADPETLCDIKIAVGEALTNAYRHGSPQKGTSTIEVRCMTCPSAVVVEIEDEGAPFDPNATPEPDPKKLKDHGMGIYLMREAMDVVEFTSNRPGNMVRMVKWLP